MGWLIADLLLFHTSRQVFWNSNFNMNILAHFKILFLCATAYSIGCFKCISNNGANRECDDPFHNNYSTAILESPCMGGRKGRDGVFPATACIKISGYYGKLFIYPAIEY